MTSPGLGRGADDAFMFRESEMLTVGEFLDRSTDEELSEVRMACQAQQREEDIGPSEGWRARLDSNQRPPA
jgi:hypothetical protein